MKGAANIAKAAGVGAQGMMLCTKHCASRIEGPMIDDLVETARQDYIEVTSKQTGGKVRYFLCPHCRASFDAINALRALDECVAHVRTCGASD